MAMQTDVLPTTLTSSGVVFEGRARVKGLVISPGGSAGSVAIADGSTTLFTIGTVAQGETFNVLIPGEGVLCATNVYATLSNANCTVFYG
jgi:hypothetical protein